MNFMPTSGILHKKTTLHKGEEREAASARARMAAETARICDIRHYMYHYMRARMAAETARICGKRAQKTRPP